MVFEWFKRLFKQTDKQTDVQTGELTPSGLEKESLQLGFAAGYTGRSIHDINAALNRIEAILPNKDWLLIQFEELLRRQEESEQKRLEIILEALNSLRSLSAQAPEPLKGRLLDKISLVESKFEPSRRMKELIQLVKLTGQASFKDLAEKMNLSGSGLRSLVMMTLPRTNELEKFTVGKERWLRYKSSSVLDVQTDTQNTTNEQTNKENQ